LGAAISTNPKTTAVEHTLIQEGLLSHTVRQKMN